MVVGMVGPRSTLEIRLGVHGWGSIMILVQWAGLLNSPGITANRVLITPLLLGIIDQRC